MNRRILGAAALLAASGSLTLASPASAANRTEYTIIILDASGSMLDPALNTTDPDGNPVVRSKWDESYLRVTDRVQKLRDNLTKDAQGNAISANHCISIWRFSDTVYHQVFPERTGNPVDPTDATFHRCATDTDRTPYDEILDQTYGIFAANKPPNGAPTTPLAKTVCAAFSALKAPTAAVANARQHLILQSDGLENATPAGTMCAPDSGVTNTVEFDPAATVPGSNPLQRLWAGGVTQGSWEWKMFNMGIWGNTSPIFTDWLASESIDQFMTRHGMQARLKAVTVDIDALYDWMKTAPKANDYANIGAGLQKFYDGLSKATNGVSTMVQYVGTALPGKAHAVTGDVSDNGCVDMADYQMVTQSNVYGRPDTDGEMVNRVDANRDGWVDWRDVDTIFNHWNEGPNCQH